MQNVTITAGSVQNIINGVWDKIRKCIKDIDTKFKINPINSIEIFTCKNSDKNIVEVEVHPIVFMLPNGDHSSKEFIISVKGNITLFKKRIDNKETILQTNTFRTKVELYQICGKNRSTLKHVYGSHFHFDCDKFDHPIFHAHITDEMDEDIVKKLKNAKNMENFHFEIKPKSKLEGITRKVRLPTAQMDVFSVIVQLCADFMVTTDKESDKENFKKLQNACNFFRSAENTFGKQVIANSQSVCVRSMHWYNELG